MTETHFCLDDTPRFQMIELEEVTSTNDFLKHYRPPQERWMTLATAEYQSQGRGSGSNGWESAKGQNLLFSLLLHPRHIGADRMFVLSEALALAVWEALEEFCGERRVESGERRAESGEWRAESGERRVESGESPLSTLHHKIGIKWPNDIYYGDRKVCGMLIENDLRGTTVENCVMGVGINVNQTKFSQHIPNPISLAQILGHSIERRFVLERVMESFCRYYEWTEQGRNGELHAMYLSHLYRKDEKHHFRDETGDFEGTIIDVESSGHLIIRDEKGRQRKYAFKEVEYVISEE